MPTMRHIRIFMSFHHICLRTLLAPLRKPWAETARLSVLSCRVSSRVPRSDTLLMLSRMMPTVLSISWEIVLVHLLECRVRNIANSSARHFARLARPWRLCMHSIYNSQRCREAVQNRRSEAEGRRSWTASRAMSRNTWRPPGRAKECDACKGDSEDAITYRLEGRSAVVAILALASCVAAGWYVRVVGLLTIGHGCGG
jgi:hypothetical protein